MRPVRIACVRIGRFAIGALLGPGAHRRAEPVALIAEERGTPRVALASALAERRGVELGMPLPVAKALVADLVALPWDEERIRRAALEVTTALLAASPRVAWERGQDVWWADAAGLGDEAKLKRKLAATANGLGYGPAQVGLADSAIAAYAATHSTAIVPHGTDAAFLAPFPLALLSLDDDLAETFAALGLTTLGQVAALEEGKVEARFGLEGLAARRLALGIDPRGPTAPRKGALPAIEVELGGPVATAEPLLFVLKGALASLGESLRVRGLAAREVTIALRLDDGSVAERAVRPARPTSHADALLAHCRAALEAWRVPEPVTGLALRASVTAPAAGEQGDLLAPRWTDPSALAAAFERIRGSEGSDAVAVPELRDGHLPEDGGAWSAEAAGEEAMGPRRGEHLRGAARRGPIPTSARPPALRLRTPEPIRVRLGKDGLEAFRHGDTWHDVTAWSGPERLMSQWWRDGGSARDYFTARTVAGTLWLLFRSAKRWFVEGWWD